VGTDRRERFWIRQFLIQRDGQKCLECGGTPYTLDIDHIDGNPTNDSPSNLRLLCRSCNTSRHIRKAQGIVSFLEREGESASQGLPSSDPTSVLKAKVNYSIGSPEMQVNDAVETAFRNWAFALLLSKGQYPQEDLIVDGAERTGASINAMRNYVKKMCSPQFGPLESFRFAGKGPRFVRIKDDVLRAVRSEQRSPTEAAQGT